MVIVSRPRETGDPRVRTPGSIEYAEAYHQIVHNARRRVLGEEGSGVVGGAAVLILTTPEADSLAAARILTRLLADDQIAFRIAPVNGYRSLREVLTADVEGRIEVSSFDF